MDPTHRRPASDSSPAAEVLQGPNVSWDVHGTYQDGSLLTPREHAAWRPTWETVPLAVAEKWDSDLERARWARRQGNDWPVPAVAAAIVDEHARRAGSTRSRRRSRPGSPKPARRLTRAGVAAELELGPLTTPADALRWLHRLGIWVSAGRLSDSRVRAAVHSITRWLLAHEACLTREAYEQLHAARAALAEQVLARSAPVGSTLEWVARDPANGPELAAAMFAVADDLCTDEPTALRWAVDAPHPGAFNRKALRPFIHGNRLRAALGPGWRRGVEGQDVDFEDEHPDPHPDCDPAAIVRRIEAQLEVDALLARAKFEPREAEVVANVLTLLGGEPEYGDLAELARKWGLKPTTVHGYWHKAKEKLRRASPV